jgi:succinoglycan biosynthesis transport protein ExoP
MELLQAWAALRRRRWLFLQAVAFFVVGAVALALVLPKRWQSTARVSVDTSSASLSILADMDLSEMAQSLAGAGEDMQTKLALAQLRPVLEEVTWRLQLRDGDGKLLPPEKLLVPGIDGELLARPWVSITQQQGTNLLLVTGTADSAELAALVADTLVDVYLEASIDRARADTRQALAFVQEEQKRLQAQLDRALTDVSSAQRAESIIDLDAETKAAVGRTSALVAAIGEADAQVADLKAQIRRRLQTQRKENEDLVAPATAARNDQVKALRASLSELRLLREKQLLDKTPRHPDVIALDKQIAATRKELAAALREEHALDPALEALHAQVEGTLERREELLGLVKKTVEEAGAYPEKGRRIAELKLAADATQSIYRALIEQEYQIAVADAMTVSDVKRVEFAAPPERHTAPKLPVMLVLGSVVGAAVGAGLVFLMEYVDDSVTGPESLREAWDAPLLAMLPRWRGPRGADGSSGRHLIHALPPTDPVFESYRSLRAALGFAGVDAPIDVLTVTSCAPGEGKSSVAMNLAVCMAHDGLRVAVVDCDLRRPTQHRAFPHLANIHGVSTVLTQAATLADTLQAIPVPGASGSVEVLTSGPVPQDPGRMVESLRLRQLLTELARSHDRVIVDAPPVLAVDDAIALAHASRGTIVVVEAGRTTRRMLMDLRTRLETAGVRATGVVLNKVDGQTGRYGHYAAYRTRYAPADAARERAT